MNPPLRICSMCLHGGPERRGRLRRSAFTFTELLVAMSIFIVMMSLLFSIIGSTSSLMRQSTSRIEAFQNARIAFESLTRTVAQATLNTYWDYDNATNPTRYIRQSDLAFLIGRAGVAPMPGVVGSGQAAFFAAPANFTRLPGSYGGLESLLNVCGFYVAFTNSSGAPPFARDQGWRYRLMQLSVPTENFMVYSNGKSNSAWFTSQLTNALPIADNIIAMVLWPRMAPAEDTNGTRLTTNYTYNSYTNALNNPQPIQANQPPPNVLVTLIAIDEASAIRLQNGANQPAVIAAALSNRFLNVTNYASDLEAIETSLQNERVNYRIFTSLVPLREAKWSTN